MTVFGEAEEIVASKRMFRVFGIAFAAFVLLGVIGTVMRDAPSGGSSATANRSSDAPSTSVSSIPTSAGSIQLGETWDDALPKLNTGNRLSAAFAGPDRAVETRRFDGQTYQLTFERHDGGPLKLTGIERR